MSKLRIRRLDEAPEIEDKTEVRRRASVFTWIFETKCGSRP